MDTTEMMIMVIMVMALPTFPLPFDAAWTLCNLAKFPSQIKKKKKERKKKPQPSNRANKKKFVKEMEANEYLESSLFVDVVGLLLMAHDVAAFESS